MAWIRLALVLIAVGLVYFHRLDRPLLWGDEAETGNGARRALRLGYPTGYDERNLSLYENGAQYNRDFVTQKIPWIQYYVGALSLTLFGDGTAGLRALFVFIGLLAFFPIRAVLRPRVRFPDLIAGLALLAPQIVLFQRSARYYPILILLYGVLVWHLSVDFKSARTRFLTAAGVFVLLFHTHPFAAACSAFSLLIFCLLFRRPMLAAYGLAAGLGFLSWLAWYELLGRPLASSDLALSLFFSRFPVWFWTFSSSLRSVPLDFDVVGCFPTLLMVAACAIVLWRHRRKARDLGRDPLVAFVLINVIVQGFATAALFGGETVAQLAILRYMPHLLAFAFIACFVVLDSAIGNKYLYLSVCVGAVALNVGSMAFWLRPDSRPAPVSWLAPVYGEIFQPPASPWDALVGRLRREPSASDRSVIGVLPSWSQDIAIFYLGDRYLIPPVLKPPADELAPAIRRAMGAPASQRLFSRPDWIVDADSQLKGAPAGYDVAALIPSHELRPDEGARPELTRHKFWQPEVVAGIALFRREGEESP
jgi:hypothetical protein